MRSKSFIAVAVLLTALLVAAGAVYAYDSSRSDVIAKGVSVGGVDVGGLKANAAKAKLRDRLLRPLARPVVATWHKRHFTLTPAAARVGVNIDRSVDAALERSREGGIIGRTFRGLTGSTLSADLRVRVTYDRAAVRRLVKHVQAKLDRAPVDATVSFAGGAISKRPSVTGREVAATRLRRALKRELVSPTADRSVAVQVRHLEPKVTTGDLASQYPSLIIVNRSAFTLHLYHDLQPVRDYRIAVGRVGLETPAGLYHIQDKQVDPSWHVPNSAWAGDLAGKVIPPGPDDPIKARWMGIYNGAGIHGTDELASLGTAASHGCIRMAIPDVEDLYDRVSVGTPVYIV
jgi:lipoprotein-anchoring transpeptidase ErfK/SrfK